MKQGRGHSRNIEQLVNGLDKGKGKIGTFWNSTEFKGVGNYD